MDHLKIQVGNAANSMSADPNAYPRILSEVLGRVAPAELAYVTLRL
jgi:hypothetical protein